MNKTARILLPLAGAAMVAGVGVPLLTAGSANAATTPTALPATFRMYANVDAEGDLGSNSSAVSVKRVPETVSYTVTFAQPIGHCAAAVQSGKAGGPDQAGFADSTVVANGTKSFSVTFARVHDDGGVFRQLEPFMLTVTCRK